MRSGTAILGVLLGAFFWSTGASEIAGIVMSNTTVRVKLPLVPHVQRFTVERAKNLGSDFLPAQNGSIEGFDFIDALTTDAAFYRVKMELLSSNEVLTAIVLNRLAYGQTPDELERVSKIGPEAYIDEQLRPEAISEGPGLDDFPQLTNGWEFVTMTGAATSSDVAFTLDEGGPAYIDDVQLVKGSVAGAGPNLIRNGDFEAPLNGDDWVFGPDFVRSRIVDNRTHDGKGALQIMAEYNPQRDNLVRQTIRPALVPYETYTLSYWYYRDTNRPNYFSMFVVGSSPEYGIASSPDDLLPLGTKVHHGLATRSDLSAWHVLRAVSSRRQLLQVLLQFVDNHFVTATTKTLEFFGNVYDGGGMMSRYATYMEYQELQRWTRALLDPRCTFYDLLRISAESPAMIIYLDGFRSRGANGSVPNENYARELLELFTFGVDNGYDQEDVTTMARVWSGWTVQLVDYANANNPLAPMSTNLIEGFSGLAWRNLIGAWSCGFLPAWHDPREKILFREKRVPERFGQPYANRNYELRLPDRWGSSGVQDIYDVLGHIANQPFTQEFICVKLCRLFVHDEFYAGYDFTSPSLSAEGRLVRACMEAWEQNSPRGQIRKVLEVIFKSDLFRSENAASQKIKTPLEFTASVVRALQSKNPDGTVTASTDGYSHDAPMARMGNMILFDREQPDGAPENAPVWLSVSALVERARFAADFLTSPGQRAVARNGFGADPVALLKRELPANLWNEAAAVSDFFLAVLFPAEGKASLDPWRRVALQFLNTADDAQVSSPFRLLSSTSATYDTRIRGLVAFLLSSPRFQEQ